LGRQLGLQRSARSTGSWRWPDRKVAAAIAVGIALLYGLGRWRRKPWLRTLVRSVTRGREGPAIYLLYQRALERFATRGWARQAAETPSEFVARLDRSGVPDTAAMRDVTRYYVAARYGDRQIPHDVLAALSKTVNDIGRAHARQGGAPPPSAAAG